MNKHGNRKKIVLGLALVGAVALAGIQTAGAGPWGGGPCNGNGNPGYGCNAGQLNQASQEARNKFMNDTVQIRKDLATRWAEKRALMTSGSPDAKRVARLTGEIFDLREQLRSKADENGIQNVGFMGGMGNGHVPGMGRGHGRGCNGNGGYFQGRL